MKDKIISRNEFVKLPTDEIAALTKSLEKPKVGIFIPDGNRRMTLAFTQLDPSSDEFYFENARMTTDYFIKNLKVFINHGLDTLFVPLISGNVLDRNHKYQQITLKQGLKTIFKAQQWLNFYKENDIRVHIYGNLERLKESKLTELTDWIDEIQASTAKNRSRHLFYGFLSPNRHGTELSHLAIDFYKKYGREPEYQELVYSYYGVHVASADFFIMSTKFAGLGALPPLICGQETQLYFLPAPGVMALTQETYREILYDLLFHRPKSANNGYSNFDLQNLELLKNYYLKQGNNVIGLGERIGKFWVPLI